MSVQMIIANKGTALIGLKQPSRLHSLICKWLILMILQETAWRCVKWGCVKCLPVLFNSRASPGSGLGANIHHSPAPAPQPHLLETKLAGAESPLWHFMSPYVTGKEAFFPLLIPFWISYGHHHIGKSDETKVIHFALTLNICNCCLPNQSGKKKAQYSKMMLLN